MNKRVIYAFSFILISCTASRQLMLSPRNSTAISGSEFYRNVMTVSREERERIAMNEILGGNIPSFIRKFEKISVSINDDGRMINAYYFVLPDYLCVGNDLDFARIPLSPMTAQKIADSFGCFLPTRKIVNDIYLNAKVRLEPMPLLAHRDSSLIFWHHHLIIEGQRKSAKGLIAGIKKDVVISSKISRDPKANRVAIYGWHKPDGNPIQPLYTGHVNWYVDYSHGIRLIHRIIYVEGKPMDYIEVLKHPVLRKLLCDENDCDYYRY